MVGGTYYGLPLFQQYAENEWASLSNYGFNTINSGSNYSQTFNGMNRDTGDSSNGNGNYAGDPVTLNNYNDLMGYIYVLLDVGSLFDQNLGGISGDWSHDEL